jgi:hypothetical protein
VKSPGPLRPEIEVLHSRWMQSIRYTRSQNEDRSNLNMIAATSNFYVPTYQPKRWQEAAFPILCRRLNLCKSKIGLATPLADPNLACAESILSQLEFGGKVVSPLTRLRLRKNIVSHGLSSWAVRQAFNSIALKREGSVLSLRRQPSWIYWSGACLMWTAASMFVFLFGITFIDALHPSLTQESLTHLFIGLNACTALMAMSYTLGPQWKQGQEVLEKLIGS